MGLFLPLLRLRSFGRFGSGGVFNIRSSTWSRLRFSFFCFDSVMGYKIAKIQIGGGKTAVELATMRGRAINSYALLEQCLCELLSVLTDMDSESARIIFFRISNARYRNDILHKVKKKKIGTQYNLYWNSAFKLAKELDQQRNSIVHWHAVTNISFTENNEQVDEPALVPPSQMGNNPNSPSLTIEDLNQFIFKTDFLCRSLTQLRFQIKDPTKFENAPAWQEIFQQELVYPPPSDHPLAHKRPIA